MPPSVSIIVPCYNEQETIGALLGSISRQTYPRADIEVLIADGMSDDKTREVIAAFSETHPDLAVRIVDNVRRTIPSSLNLAIGAARGEFLIRLDAHSIPIPQYVERCVEAIEQGKGSNVGGAWIIEPAGTGWMAAGIAAAAAHPLGAGDARYRLDSRAGEVDTVPFGAFRRSLIEKIGGFDESLLTNEDYEFNTRIRQSGGVVWLDPEIQSTYFARATLGELARQYLRYGFWKCKMLFRYPRSLRWRQALPPMFVLSVLALALTSAIWPPARPVLAVELILYLAAVMAAGLSMAVRRRRAVLMPGSVLALITMHWAWGAGFLWSALASMPNRHG
jgi:glycosyltransferase involved in cell wall biosynthesis